MFAIAAAERCKQLYQNNKKHQEALSGGDGSDLDHKDISVKGAADGAAEQNQQAAQTPKRSKALTTLAHNMHFTSFAPLVLIQVLQDIDLGLGAIICVAWVLLTIFVSWRLAVKGYLQVFPKKFDFFNLQLYCTIIVLAYTVQHWIHNWISVYVNAANAGFMWATIFLPCYENFVMDSIRDRVPAAVADHPIMKRMALLIACSWASALTVMTAASIIPAAVNLPPQDMGLMIILCSYVFGIGPMVVAIAAQHVIKLVYTKKLKAAFGPQLQQQGQQQQQASDDAV